MYTCPDCRRRGEVYTNGRGNALGDRNLNVTAPSIRSVPPTGTADDPGEGPSSDAGTQGGLRRTSTQSHIASQPVHGHNPSISTQGSSGHSLQYSLASTGLGEPPFYIANGDEAGYIPISTLTRAQANRAVSQARQEEERRQREGL